MVGRGECKCLATRGQWCQQKEIKEEGEKLRRTNQMREPSQRLENRRRSCKKKEAKKLENTLRGSISASRS
ncbi:hypothetical protein H5410_020801 [Solanum commersonii]|uniref:Uncharacterized protein n=1 Tax=Solanum commersonii TaxID=4109 RepID=A0A9J5ZCC6_SOLCO|nr:hypothetical protein H5410_020801 [Solanum commersonii]